MFGYSKTIEILEKENAWLKGELINRNSVINDLINKFVFNKRQPETIQNLDLETIDNTQSISTEKQSHGATDGYAKALRNAEKQINPAELEKIDD